jgi:hypothetical protein
MTGPNCRHTSLYEVSNYNRQCLEFFLGKHVVCLALKFSSGVKVFTRSITWNNSENVVAFKEKYTIVC